VNFGVSLLESIEGWGICSGNRLWLYLYFKSLCCLRSLGWRLCLYL